LLLQYCSFNEITVRIICAEAFVSGATFYLYFKDKYDLLQYFLAEAWNNVADDADEDEELERKLIQFICSNERVLTNMLKDANARTQKCLREFMYSIIGNIIKVSDQVSPNQAILCNFCVGGLLNHITWAVDNALPPKLHRLIAYLFRMIKSIAIWDAEQVDNATVPKPKCSQESD